MCLYGLGIALRENARTRKFTRGAITITMQVARNLFLTHNRNLVRKTEEAIMELLLENYYKIDKRTIFELYANLIEFAPGVYGVADACRFYFGKELSELTLTEILSLTYIILRPVHFYEALLEKTQQLQTNMRRHIGNFASTMLQKGMISPVEYGNISYTLRFAPQFGTLDLPEEKKPKTMHHPDTPESVRKLLTAYPLPLKGYDGKIIVLHNGLSVEYKSTGTPGTDGDPDLCIDDLFRDTYPKGVPVDAPATGDAGRVRHQELLMKMYGSSPEQVRRNLVPVQWCPKLVNQTLWCSRVNNVHRHFARVSAELDEHPEWAGYLNSGGTFNWRTIAGSRRLSAHSFGTAIDIAVEHSHYWQWGKTASGDTIPDRPENKIPQAIVDVFEKHGFIWGGRWRHYDTMHFEYRPELLPD